MRAEKRALRNVNMSKQLTLLASLAKNETFLIVFIHYVSLTTPKTTHVYESNVVFLANKCTQKREHVPH